MVGTLGSRAVLEAYVELLAEHFFAGVHKFRDAL